MHKKDHREKGNYKTNHTEYNNKSNIDRKQFDKARVEYWKYEYDNWNKNEKGGNCECATLFVS